MTSSLVFGGYSSRDRPPPPYSSHKSSIFLPRRATSNPAPPADYPSGYTPGGFFAAKYANPVKRNRSLSLRSKKGGQTSTEAQPRKFGFSSMRASTQPELSKKLYRLIKSENHVINNHTNAGREQISIASQLSDWGLATNDDAISDISDKIGVMLSELGELEITYAQNLEDFRAVLKSIRNVEASVQPSRDKRNKITDEIQRLKYKEPQSPKLVQLEQELVRAEAENLVAEAQLSNVTRQKLKEAYAQHFASVVERSQKQEILAKHSRRLLSLLDDTPVVPGDTRPTYDRERDARQILADAEDDLRSWTLELEEVPTNAMLDAGAMPAAPSVHTAASTSPVINGTGGVNGEHLEPEANKQEVEV
ncbi:hypothetical protein H072_1786 [Dactylellina haptotyla CBS 200.50]|uniref:Sphingolipid long chain base-responsive protein LSP1 n=1 Tax=Dactylellina haptotyla (strain CBS 200.50) TaxID=1284197 RepID=S8AN15_DACHA|nr:hypothetical protein H072_1786 [Dactylellina haptotyla CBS 200.50]